MPPYVGIALTWIILTGVFAAILTPLNVPRIWGIYSHPANTVGLITGSDCANHARIDYVFKVSDIKQTGHASFDFCSKAKEGQNITIYYDSRDPSRNVIMEPKSALWNEIIPIGGVCLTFPPLIIWQFFSWKRRSLLKMQA
jgi:hypothetical protein